MDSLVLYHTVNVQDITRTTPSAAPGMLIALYCIVCHDSSAPRIQTASVVSAH